MYSILSISNETHYNFSAMALVNSVMVAPPPQLWEEVSEDIPRRDPLYVVIPITIVFVIIFLTGMIGNVSTCIVIAKNKYMHTATNYYLFSLAISDLLLLVSGLPQEMHSIWYRYPYLFGEVFCILQGFAAETSANATVLTITAFTVERYVAICHPLRSHTLSRLSRAVKLVLGIWVAALLLAVPQAIQFGIVTPNITTGGEELSQCTTKRVIVQHAFEISTFVFFVLPMTIITVLYILIGLRLRSSRALNRRTSSGGSDKTNNADPSVPRVSKSGNSAKSSQNHVIKMLVAVVAAFFICWAPFHAQRLLAVYGDGGPEGPSDTVRDIYHALTYVSGVLYYLSTTVNPVLYHIMSNKFRDAFKHTISTQCGWGSRSSSTKRTYSVLSAHQLARNGSHAAAAPPPLRIRAASVYNNNPSPPPDSPQHEPLLVTVVEEGAENGGIVTKLHQREKTICFRSASVDTSASSLDTAAETAANQTQPDVVRYLGTIEKERISR